MKFVAFILFFVVLFQLGQADVARPNSPAPPVHLTTEDSVDEPSGHDRSDEWLSEHPSPSEYCPSNYGCDGGHFCSKEARQMRPYNNRPDGFAQLFRMASKTAIVLINFAKNNNCPKPRYNKLC
ncbi:hypothetical protein M3Y97_00951500 [Aphelenchoides bicaudatus]|nr:hypothetical protein M3Y97_00951500 [Aphelenchoides bicaudatus]